MSTSQGLTCPNCTAVIPIPEGSRIVTCPSCTLSSMVQGERGIRRWQVQRKIERDQAEKAVTGFYRGMNKARDLKRRARIIDIFLIYLPYWRIQAFIAGWMFGRVKSGEKSTKPVEVEVLEEMHWNDAAVDVSEYGVERIVLSKDQLEPFDEEYLHSEGMVFQPAESRTDAEKEATMHFTHRGRQKRSLSSRFFEKFYQLQKRFSLVYYPLWVARYDYKGRHYQVVVDGVEGKVLYGKAPGNIFYRAAMLVLGMAVGNLFLVNGCALMFLLVGSSSSSSDSDNALGAIIIPVIIGAIIMFAGYRAFRYGEEVEKLDSKNRKAEGVAGSRSSGAGSLVDMAKSLNNNSDTGDLIKMGMKFIDEL